MGAGPADGEGPIGQGAVVGASGDGDGQTAADGGPIAGPAATAGSAAVAGTSATAGSAGGESTDAGEAVAQSSAVVVAAKAPTVPSLAISDLIRSAAEQATATWKSAAVPPQRRESPATPFRTVSAPAPVVPQAKPDAAKAASPAAALSGPASPTAAAAALPAAAAVMPAAAPSAPATVPLVAPTPLSSASADDTVVSSIVEVEADYTGAAIPAATEPDTAATATEAEDDHWPGARRQIAILTGIVSLLILAVLLGHRYLPDALGFGSLIDTFLPWTAVPLLLALPAALFSLKKRAVGVCLLSCAVWAGMFGPTLMRTAGSGPADIRVLSQNVSSGESGAPDLSGVARLAEQRGADIVVLQGLSKNMQVADQAVPARYQYHVAMYEFVVWSRFPIGGGQPVDLAGGRLADAQSGSAAVGTSSGEFGGLLRFTVNLDQNRQVTVYAVHLPQPSLSHDGFGLARGDALEQLVDEVQAEKSPHLIVVGDLDVAQTDRAIGPLLGSATGLVSAQAEAGGGFGFTWPASFPVVRLDDVLTRGLTPVASVVLPAVGPQQAHRPIEADLKF